ncbi:MAG: DUF438 domain-containing protein, partial [Chloroflexi bacterium]|nr:DUF438 domain-containing protein [Chloroflexota bacterium]
HKTEYSLPSLKEKLGELLQKLKGIDRHYERKEQILFPYLEKQGFMGPSKVMWGKDNEVRDLFRAALQELPAVKTPAELDAYIDKNLNKLIEEVEGMIFKEENILFPTCLEKLSPSDWVEILRESDDIGYVFIQKPEETEVMVKSLRAALQEEALVQDGTISFPTGSLRLDELLAVMNTLPIDMTFVDKDDRVRYFSEGKSRVFHRTKSVIERRVQNCHPPQSVDVVEKILNAFKEGKKDSYSFWLNYQGKFVYIQYFAVRDREGRYLGTMEVTQDISEITQLKGEKRLLDERD